MSCDDATASTKIDKTFSTHSATDVEQLTMTIDCDVTSTDNGRLHIRVKRIEGAEACISYRLVVTAE